MIIITDHGRRAAGQYLPGIHILDLILEIQAFGSQAGYACADLDMLFQLDGRQVIQVDTGDDQTQPEEVLPVPQAQVEQILHPGGFEEGQELGIVDMPLRIQIHVPDLEGDVEIKGCHGLIIRCWKSTTGSWILFSGLRFPS